MPSEHATPFMFLTNVPRDRSMDRAVALALAEAGYAPDLGPGGPSWAEDADDLSDGGMAEKVVMVFWSPADDNMQR